MGTWIMVTPALNVSPDCALAGTLESEPAASTKKSAVRMITPPPLLRNLYPCILGSELLALGVAHYQPDQIGAGLHVEICGDSHGRLGLQPLNGLVPKTKLQSLLGARDEIAIGIEHRGHYGQIVPVPVIRLPQVDQ